MANKKSIRKHNDKNFVKGLKRYLLAELILESTSMEDLLKKISVNRWRGSGSRIHKELKIYNAILLTEQYLARLLEGLYLQKKWKNDPILLLRQKLMRYRKIKKQKEAENILKSETSNDSQMLLSPHILFYVCGIGLGDVIGILRDNVKNFRGQAKLLEKLDRLNQYRTNIVHNMLSSRTRILFQSATFSFLIEYFIRS